MKTKICGLTNAEDALKAAELGADYTGFIFYSKSPRYVTAEQASSIIKMLPESTKAVGVFVNQSLTEIEEVLKVCDLSLVQLHGEESPEFASKVPSPVIKAFRVKGEESLEGVNDYDVFAYLLDSYNGDLYGGTGKMFDLSLLAKKHFNKPVFLSGGLTTENVCSAIKEVQPYAVDVCSGTESEPGKKDHNKLTAFVAAIEKCV
ncbi:hypothetical protein LCGC14_0760170 [marine sediment metagenome]|uniref:phosphoribosylanthranilate isomerase n=1 Tax=marine sediment metagenome TaxID=412755 RepID=A0A0F9Q5J2_9ZZZZ|nr:phosphoribosylanthranilate isomerase [Actinomycetota bacterium]